MTTKVKCPSPFIRNISRGPYVLCYYSLQSSLHNHFIVWLSSALTLVHVELVSSVNRDEINVSSKMERWIPYEDEYRKSLPHTFML